MKIFNGVVIAFYTLVSWAAAVFLIAFSVNIVKVSHITDALHKAEVFHYRTAIGIAGLCLFLLSILIIQNMRARFVRGKTIAFSNPDGQVVISLKAIEDFIKNVAQEVEEVKEVKSEIVANRRGIMVTSKASVYAGTNIPETTERIQGIIKNRVQDVLGVEEEIKVSVYVVKVVSGEGAGTKKTGAQETASSPFHGKIEYK